MQTLGNFVAGELRPAASARAFDVWEPAVGRVHARAPDSDENDVEAAVRAAEAAFPGWRDQVHNHRGLSVPTPAACRAHGSSRRIC